MLPQVRGEMSTRRLDTLLAEDVLVRGEERMYFFA
jgi:hypothetical protein